MITPGDLFKASFGHDGDMERMWAEATRIDGQIVYGSLRNDPVALPAKFGDPVWVRIDDIHEIQPRG